MKALAVVILAGNGLRCKLAQKEEKKYQAESHALILLLAKPILMYSEAKYKRSCRGLDTFN